jgi:hypothetical protein
MNTEKAGSSKTLVSYRTVRHYAQTTMQRAGKMYTESTAQIGHIFSWLPPTLRSFTEIT